MREPSETIVMLKPDAIEGMTSQNVAKALFIAFANHITHNTIDLPKNMMSMANKAEKQAYERSLTEVAFQGKLNESEQQTIISDVTDVLSQLQSPLIPTCTVIKTGIEAIGCDIMIESQYRLKVCDVDEIYSLCKPNAKLTQLSKRLHEYLDERSVLLLKLRCKNGTFLLQHWKTFARHFLILNRTEEFPLINLIHVCEDDYEYLNQLLLHTECK